jgi:1,4-dihydroxy-2-naphthoyl-CoA synthase
MDFENFAAECAKIFEPCAEVWRKLRIDFAAEALGNGGAFSSGGDCDLKIAAGDYGAEEKVAVGNVVNAVARDVSFEAALIDSGVCGWIVGGGYDQEVAVEIGGVEGALDQF